MSLMNKYLSITRELMKAEEADSIKDALPGEIDNQTLEEFGRTSCALIVDSFCGRICFAADDRVAAKMRSEGFVVYTASELERLIQKQYARAEIEKIHELKSIFPGSRIEQ